VGEDWITRGTERYTVSQAADMLGITTGAVRNRISRGTLPKVKESGTVYVLLPAGISRDAERDATDTPTGMPPPESGALTSELRDRLRYVEDQLERERQAHAEARRIIAGLVERIPAIEAPQEETRESPEGSAERVESTEPRPASPDQQAGSERPWWRRIFGS